MNYPILLRSEGQFTSFMIYEAHVTVKHTGVASTLNELRQNYWVCRGTQVVKRILNRCVTCKENQGKTLKGPEYPILPHYRLSAEFAF